MFEFINYPAVRFKKSELNKENIYKYFMTDEDDYFDWYDSVLQAIIKNEDTYDLVESRNINLYFDSHILNDWISKFTYADCDLEKVKNILSSLVKDHPEEFKSLEIDKNKIILETSFTRIFAAKLSSCFPILKELLPNMDTKKRRGECHNYVCDIAKYIEIPFPAKVASGYIKPFSSADKCLHTWIEIKDKGKEYVLDASKNLMMNKKGYYFINNISSPVYKIPPKTVGKEEDLIIDMERYAIGLSKLYFANRHQALAFYRQLKAEERRKQESDPLYQAAKVMSEGFKRMEREERRKQNKAQKQKGE